MINIVIADGHALVRSGLRMIIEAEPDMNVVGEAADGPETIEVTRRTSPHVVLLDVGAPTLGGIRAARTLTSANPSRPRVLMLSALDDDEQLHEAIRAGASGFLLKDVSAAELTHAIRLTAAGQVAIAPAIILRILQERIQRPLPARPPAGIEELTERETEVFSLIARGLSNAEIADELTVGRTTVKTHVTRILMKLSLRDRVQAVVHAYESGLVQPRY